MFAAIAVLDDIQVVARPPQLVPRVPSATLTGVAIAAAAIPAGDFVTRGKNIVSSAARQFAPNPAWGWVKTFLGACLWAAMMAAGMLVYQHFVRKWEERGFPVLPVAALTTVAQTAQGKPLGPIHLGSGTTSTAAPSQRAPSHQTSFLDEYEG
jgi:hypothetical protein